MQKTGGPASITCKDKYPEDWSVSLYEFISYLEYNTENPEVMPEGTSLITNPAL